MLEDWEFVGFERQGAYHDTLVRYGFVEDSEYQTCAASCLQLLLTALRDRQRALRACTTSDLTGP